MRFAPKRLIKGHLAACAFFVYVFMLLAISRMHSNRPEFNMLKDKLVQVHGFQQSVPTPEPDLPGIKQKHESQPCETMGFARNQLWDSVRYPVEVPPEIKQHPYFTQPRKKNCTVFGEVLLEPYHCAKEDDADLLVLVPSEGWEPDMRQAVRDTWGAVSRDVVWPGGKELCMKVKVVYVLGLSGLGRSADMFSAIKEQTIYNDILLLDMVDSYWNLTHKMLLSLKWALKRYPKTKYVLKADQDAFVHMPRLTAYLKNFGTGNSLYGLVEPNAEIYRAGTWSVTEEVLPLPYYPPYAIGDGYVLSIDAVDKILNASCFFPPFPVEDAYITGVLAVAGHVQQINKIDFNNRVYKSPVFSEFTRDKQLIGGGFDEQLLRALWEEFGGV